MANLYEIDQGILSCLDAETGEIIDPELLNTLLMEREAKVEGVALWIKNLESDILALKAEKDAFAEREAQAKKKVESLKKWLAEALEGQKFSTAKCAVSFRRSVQVEILDENAIPEDLLVETVVKRPNKVTIKERLKNGEDIIGCRLVENLNTQIR